MPFDLQGLAEALPDATIVLDTTARVRHANRAATGLLGMALDDLIGTPIGELCEGGGLGDAVWHVGIATEASESLVRLRGASDETMIVSATSKVTQLDNEVLCIVSLRKVSSLDDRASAEMGATEREVLQDALRRNETRLALAIEVSKVGIFDRVILPHEGSTPYWSSSMRKMLGYDEEAPADPEWFRVRVQAEYMERMVQAITRANGGDGWVEVEVGWNHPDGGTRFFLIRSRTLFTQEGGARLPTRSIGALLDITELRMFEEELRQRSEIMDATPDFVAIADLKGRLVYVNKAGRKFMGLSDEDVLQPQGLGRILAEDNASRLKEELIPIAVREGLWSGEVEFIRHDGLGVPMSQVILAHQNAAGTVTHLSTIARDLSKERQLEAQFMQAQKMEAVGRLAGGVAHDFNNLLSVIMGSCELAMLDLEPGHPSWKELEQVNFAAQRAAALTQQLLAFGRKQALQPRVHDLGEVLRELTPMLIRVIGETIDVRIDPGDRPTLVRADRTQIQQLLLNLVVNARDAMPDGGTLRVEVSQRPLEDEPLSAGMDLAQGIYASLRVSDDGHGMDAAVREHIFEPFYTTKGPGQGTGLGLSTVFGIVRQSGGGIRVDSEVGRGTAFEILFPISEETSASVESEAPVLIRRAGQRRVLLAEDNHPLRDMITQVLRRAGYEVHAAPNADEALRAARDMAGPVDLLLTDVLMPGRSGRHLADQLLSERPGTPVLFMSGYTEDDIVHHGVLEPTVSFLEKPITPSQLLIAVAEALGDRLPSDGSPSH